MVYEDEYVAVFPTLNPINEGHLLVIPKKHASSLSDLDPEDAGRLMKIAQKMDVALRKSKFKCEAVGLSMADGEAAGQEVFHVHLHVAPRYKGDGYGFKIDPTQHLIKQERHKLDAVADEVKRNL